VLTWTEPVDTLMLRTALITLFLCSLSTIPAACSLGPVSLIMSACEVFVGYLIRRQPPASTSADVHTAIYAA
jgi:hypothetical protein